MTVECDGVDITPRLRQHKVHSVLFLNVPCFGSGTRPWSSAAGHQRMDDGLIGNSQNLRDFNKYDLSSYPRFFSFFRKIFSNSKAGLTV